MVNCPQADGSYVHSASHNVLRGADAMHVVSTQAAKPAPHAISPTLPMRPFAVKPYRPIGQARPSYATLASTSSSDNHVSKHGRAASSAEASGSSSVGLKQPLHPRPSPSPQPQRQNRARVQRASSGPHQASGENAGARVQT